jgi:hypothetical protein
MRPKQARVQPDAGDPIGDQPGAFAAWLSADLDRDGPKALKKNSPYIIFDRLSGMETHHCGVEHEIGEP